jgi:hypothetical protein
MATAIDLRQDLVNALDPATDSLAAFCEYESQGAWQRAAHLELLCSKLEAVERGEIKRLCVLLPPRHGKSEVVSRHFPAWYLGRNPEREIILASYNDTLARDMSRDARRIFRDAVANLWGLSLSGESKAVERWQLEGHAGKFQASGIGGAITGRGGHVAIVDDPEKNLDEAESPTYQRHKWNWYRSTLRTRLAPGGAIVIVATRWGKKDLVGRILDDAEKGGEHWDVVCLPALAEENDLLGRAVGEPLWPERFPLSELEAIKRSLGGRLWNGLYQQDPEEDVEGALWQREAMIDAYRVTEAPPLIRKVVSIDPSGSGRTSADEVGIGVAGLGRDRHGYVLRDLSGHYSPQQWAQKAIDAYYDEKADFIVAESNFGGDMVEANIHAIDPDVPVKLVSAARGKRQRAEPIATKAAQGEIHHVGTFDELEEELCTWTPLSGWSPNRLDWCVWALTELMIGIKKGGFMSVYGPRR